MRIPPFTGFKRGGTPAGFTLTRANGGNTIGRPEQTTFRPEGVRAGMKCDKCNKTATVHLTEIKSGKKIEKHLCEQCAAENEGCPSRATCRSTSC
jgi:hypothetical protein